MVKQPQEFTPERVSKNPSASYMDSYEKQEGSPMEYDKKAQVIENNSPIREYNQSKSPIRDKVFI